MNKLQLKETEIKFNSSLPTEVTGLTQIKGEIEAATKAKQLLSPLKQYADGKERLTIAKKAIKKDITALLDEAKEVETAFKTLEKEIKTKALSLVKTTLVTKVNRNGEPVTTEINDLPFGFSFTPAKIAKVVNSDKIIKDFQKDGKFAEFVEAYQPEVEYRINKEKMEAFIAAGNKVPMTKNETEAKLSIQQKDLVDPLRQNDIAALLESE